MSLFLSIIKPYIIIPALLHFFRQKIVWALQHFCYSQVFFTGSLNWLLSTENVLLALSPVVLTVCTIPTLVFLMSNTRQIDDHLGLRITHTVASEHSKINVVLSLYKNKKTGLYISMNNLPELLKKKSISIPPCSSLTTGKCKLNNLIQR